MTQIRWMKCGLLVLCAGGILSGCDGTPTHQDSEDPFFSSQEWRTVQSLSPVPATPNDPTNAFHRSDAAATLGQKFFFDGRFSAATVAPENAVLTEGGNGAPGTVGTVACARCHNPATGFADRRSVPGNTSLGVRFGSRNSQTIYNSVFNTFQYWDGRRDSLWSQAVTALENRVQSNFSRLAAAQLIFQRYRAEYEAIFGPMPPFDDPLRFPQIANPPAFETQGRPGDGPGGAGLDTYDEMTAGDRTLTDRAVANFGKAIAAYEARIVSKDSAFDRFVAGDRNALAPTAKRGLKLFIGKAFCINCHSGPNFADDRFHNLAVAQGGDHVPGIDLGQFGGISGLLADRFNGAGAFSDDVPSGVAKLAGIRQDASQTGLFRTPTLRHVDSHPPYFHTGNLRSLWDVVDFYNRGGDNNNFSGVADPRIGAPLNLTEQEVDDLVDFLVSLTGAALPATLTNTPVLPP